MAGLEDLVRARLRALGRDHPDTLSSRLRLAKHQGQAGDVPGAVAGMQELLPDLLRVLGPNHPDTETAQNILRSLEGQSGNGV